MAKYISGKVKDLNIGISNYSENKTSVTVIGNVGIGTLVPTDQVGSGNTAVLAAGIVSAYQFYGDGSNITGVGATDKVVTESLDVLGISTLRGTLSVGGVSTFTGNSTFSGDAAFHGGVTLGNATSDEVNGVARFAMDLIPSSTGDKDLGSNDPTRRWGNLHVKNIFQAGDGISTFTNDIDANADVNIAGVATVSSLVGISGSLTNINVTGIGTFSDNVKLNFGGSNDLQIYHATSGGGSTSYIDNNTGPLYIRNNVDDDDGGNIIIEAKSGKASAVFQDDEGVRLYFNDAEKFATLSTGATVTGDLYATTFYGDGSNLAGVVTNTGINTTGTSDFSTLNVSTLLDVDGHTELDDVNVSGVATFAGNVSIAGTLTYEDVTNIDSIGIVTAQGGIRLSGVVTAISGCSAVQYYGDGSGLTNVGASSTDAWIADSQENLVAGNGAGAARDADTCFNIMIGCNSGKVLNAGDYNVFMGFGAGKDATGSACNVAIGYSAGSGLTQGHNQVFIGNRAGEHASNINGRNGVAIGNYAGNNKVCHDVYIGCGAGELNDGKYNIAIGSGVGAGITDGNCNLMMGHLAGNLVTTGDTNVFLGRRAGQCATSSDNNVFIGGYAGFNTQNTASGDTNVAIGYAAGMCLGATARCNTIIGPYAGQELDAGCDNVLVGQGPGYNIAGGSYNTFLGHYTGDTTTSGSNNVAIGKRVRLPSATGSDQFAIGCCTSHWITGDSNFNVGIGTNRHDTVVGSGVTAKLSVGILSAYMLYGDGSGITNVSAGGTTTWQQDAEGNLVAGTGAGAARDADTCFNTLIGPTAGAALNSGDYNVFIGCAAGCLATSGEDNIALGRGAMSGQSLTGAGNVAIGLAAGKKLTDGEYNIHIGVAAGRCSISGDYNVTLGYYAGGGTGNFTGNDNILIGDSTGCKITTGSDNIALGKDAMSTDSVTGSYNVLFGHKAGQDINSAGCNTIIGLKAGCKFTAANNNTVIGCLAGANLDGATVAYNILIGDKAGQGTAGCSGISNNLFIGWYAGTNIQTASYNVSVGRQSGKCLTTQSRNAFFGHYAGCAVQAGCNTFLGHRAGSGGTVITGGKNIAIGLCANVPDTTGSNQLAIGICTDNWIVGNGNFNVGIGTTNPDLAVGAGNTAKLSVGIVSAYQLYGDGSGLTNVGGASTDAWAQDSQGNLVAGTGAGAARDADTELNVLIGCSAGAELCAGDRNIAIGYGAGQRMTDGNYNVFLGECTACACEITASYNVAIGKRSAEHLTTGDQNVFLGHDVAGNGIITGDKNFGGGSMAGWQLSSGQYNIFFGACAAKCLTSGENNIIMGRCAVGGESLTGLINIVLGNCTGYRLSSGGSNILLGNSAGECLTTGCHNIAFGNSAFGGCAGIGTYTTGNYNVVFGRCAGYGVTTGDYNIIIGDQAGYSIESGDENIFIGKNAGYGAETTGSGNVTVGSDAAKCITSHNNGIFLGHEAGKLVKTGYDSIYIGDGAGEYRESSMMNVAIGGGALAGSSTTVTDNDGVHNYAIGVNAGENITSGDCNQLFGFGAGDNMTTGSENTFLGHNAGRNFISGSGNIALGRAACGIFSGAANGQGNVLLGDFAGSCICGTASYNTLIGYSAGNDFSYTLTGSKNVIIGCRVGVADSTGDNQLAIGVGHTHWIIGNADFNVGIGTTNPNAAVGAGVTAKLSVGIVSTYQLYGHLMTDAEGSLYIGKDAGASSGAGACYNIAIGYEAGKVTGDENIFIGKGAGKSGTTSGSGNIFIGCYTGLCMAGGGGNQFIGDNAGRKSNGAYNVVLGKNAFCGDASHNGWNNVVIGVSAAKNVTGGNANVFIGQYAACDFTTGCRNVVIGYQVHPPSLSGDNQLAIGCGAHNWIVGDSSFNVGIGTTIPTNAVGSGNTAVLAVGILSAYQLYGDGSGLTGVGGDTFWVSNSTGIHTTSNIGIGTTNASDATVNIDVGTATTALVVQGSAGQLFSVTNSLSSGSIFSVNDISGIPSIDVDADGTIQLAPYGTGEMVGVGTTSPTSKLHVIGGALITGVVTATDVDSTSDIRLKTNIQPIEDPLAKVIQIEGVSFNWKQDNRPALGVIADQVEKILPQLVHGDDPKTVNYNGLIGLLIEAVKEQQSEIDTLKERISKLE